MGRKCLNIWDNLLDFLLNAAFTCVIASVVYLLMISVTPIKSVWISLIITIGMVSIVLLNAKRIQKWCSLIFDQLSKLSLRKMVFILFLIIVVERLGVLILFEFPTFVFNDTALYVEIAEMISSTGTVNIALSYPHLLFMGLFLSAFNFMHIPYIVGMFCLFLVGCILYFLAFTKILGKERSFLVLVGYLLMPSSIMWTFSITHEMFYFFFVSIIFYFVFDMMVNRKLIWWKIVILVALLEMSQLINPISLILMISCGIYSLIVIKKPIRKFLVILAIVAVIPLSTMLSQAASVHYLGYELKSAPFSSNLLVGASYESQGRYNQEILDQVHAQIESRGLENNVENYQKVSTELLVNEYKYLLSNPSKLLGLWATKFYIVWSGDHYSLEMLMNYNAVFRMNPAFTHGLILLMLGISACIYLLFIFLGITSVRSKSKDSNAINFTKCLLLGMMATFLIIEVMNKYSVHATILLYMIAISKINDGGTQPSIEVDSCKQ